MRISSNMPLDNFLLYQQKLMSSIVGDQLQLSTGQVVTQPSDDPVSASHILKLSEIEDAAIESGKTAEACAFGVNDDRLGQAIMLVVRGAGGDADTELKRYLKAELPNFMQPRDIIWQKELPRNPNGKLDRTEIERKWG